MILYNKNGDFLGISKDELSFLGYEDLEEFRSLHSDVAELFVNKPGYIFKFSNFSWIDYALHSGAPKKSVILKLKTGNEIEVPLRIKEIFLYTPNGNEDIYYSVELTNNTHQTSLTQSSYTEKNSEIFAPQALKKQVDEEHEPKEISFEEDFEDEPEKISFEEDFQDEPEEVSFKEDFQDEPEEVSFKEDFQDEPEEVSFKEDFEDEPNIKLKIDDSLFEEEISLPKKDETIEQISTQSDFIEQDEPEEIQKLKIDIKSEPFPNIESQYSADKIEDIKPSCEDENLDLDLLYCAEESGLDISLISEILTDYINKIDNDIPNIRTSLENETDINPLLYELKGISDNLHILELSNKLKKILLANSKGDKIKELDGFEKIIIKFKGELI